MKIEIQKSPRNPIQKISKSFQENFCKMKKPR